MPDALDVLAGVLAVAAGAGPAWLAGRRTLALPLATIAAVVALVVRGHAEPPMVIAAGTGLLLAMPHRHRLIPVYAATVALLLAGSELPESLRLPGDATAVVVASMAVAGAIGWGAARVLGGGAAWVLVSASACAVYLAVPDTEQVTVVAVAAAVASVLVLVDRDDAAAPVPAAVAVLAALVVWCAAWGAIGRPASFVAAPGALVPMIAIVAATRHRRLRSWRSWRGGLIVAGHLVVATVAARTAGLEPSLGRAVLIASVVAVVGGALSACAVLVGAVPTGSVREAGDAAASG